MRHGLPAGISGLIAGLQPILTALFAPVLVGERISGVRWLGIACGFVGIALVLEPQLAGVDPAVLWAVLLPVLINIVGMIAVTLGSFYQKARVVSGDLRTVTAIQYTAAFLVTIPVAWALEPMRIEWNVTMLLVLFWSVVVLSLGGIGLSAKGEMSAQLGLDMLLPVFAAAILGGLGNALGAAVGTVVIAAAETLVTNVNFGPLFGESVLFIPAAYATATSFLLLVVVLLVKPYGLFVSEVKRV